jgi:hypothetical protein
MSVKDIVKNVEDVDIIIGDLDPNNISSVLQKYNDVVVIREKLTKIEEMLKTKVKVFLKENKWNRYLDKETNISATLSIQKREDIDKEQLKIILNDIKLSQIMKTTTYEKLVIMTPEQRKRLKTYVMGKTI